MLLSCVFHRYFYAKLLVHVRAVIGVGRSLRIAQVIEDAIKSLGASLLRHFDLLCAPTSFLICVRHLHPYAPRRCKFKVVWCILVVDQSAFCDEGERFDLELC
jgi:hypothetical protein